MSQLPVIAENHVPVPIPRDLDDALAVLSNALTAARTLPVDRQPSPALRERLAIRADVVAGWLAPIGPTEARGMVAALLMVLPGQGSKGSVEDADRVQGLYVRALAGLPRFALRAACAAALTHGVGGKKYAPSPAELRAQAEQEANRLRAEAEKIRRVLEAKIEPPRPSDEVRKASAAAARRAFGIPEGGFTSGQTPHHVEGPDALGSIGKEILERSSMDRWRAEQARASGEAFPEDRFADERIAS